METSREAPVRAGVFRRIASADKAVAGLIAAGFTKDHVTVVCPTCTAERWQDYQRKEPAGTQSLAAAAEGGAIGALLGGLVAVTGVMLTGGAGLLIAGPLAAAGGALTGGFVGAMTTRGFERATTDYFDQSLRRGKILVAVECDPSPDQPERLAAAERVLAAAGAEPIPLRKD